MSPDHPQLERLSPRNPMSSITLGAVLLLNVAVKGSLTMYPSAMPPGGEYIISERLFEALREEEQKLWHSHCYEVRITAQMKEIVSDIMGFQLS